MGTQLSVFIFTESNSVQTPRLLPGVPSFACHRGLANIRGVVGTKIESMVSW